MGQKQQARPEADYRQRVIPWLLKSDFSHNWLGDENAGCKHRRAIAQPMCHSIRLHFVFDHKLEFIRKACLPFSVQCCEILRHVAAVERTPTIEKRGTRFPKKSGRPIRGFPRGIVWVNSFLQQEDGCLKTGRHKFTKINKCPQPGFLARLTSW